MVLSKPVYSFLGFYFDQLFNHPLRTKAITCCAIATAGNLASQYVGGCRSLAHNSLIAYAVYGLFFGGTFPHVFYNILDKWIPEDAAAALFKRVCIERLFYTPLVHAFSIYMISRLEGKDHKTALRQLEALYWPILSSNWKYLTIIQFINLYYVPPMLRVLLLNLVGFFWTIYIANKRRQHQRKEKSDC